MRYRSTATLFALGVGILGSACTESAPQEAGGSVAVATTERHDGEVVATTDETAGAAADVVAVETDGAAAGGDATGADPAAAVEVDFTGYVESVGPDGIVVREETGSTRIVVGSGSVVYLWMDGNPFPVDHEILRSGGRISGRTVDGVVVRADAEDVADGCEVLDGTVHATTGGLGLNHDGGIVDFAVGDDSSVVYDGGSERYRSGAGAVASIAGGTPVIVVSCDGTVRFVDPVD